MSWLGDQGCEPPDPKPPSVLPANYVSVPRLLRAMAGSQAAKAARHDIILEAGAVIIDETAEIMRLLEDVPGDTPLARVQRLKDWYLEFQKLGYPER